MKKISLSELTPLPDKNQQEVNRMVTNYEKHLKELADQKELLQLQAIREKTTGLHEGDDGNDSTF